MSVECFQESEGPIVETAWGHHQDVPIFRALAAQHNVGLAASKIYTEILSDIDEACS